MLVLPIKKKWFDMIKSGEKKEEYREIKPYYNKRFKNAFGFEYKDRKAEIILRNGYSRKAPTIKCLCTLGLGYGKEEWGAKPNKTYYILKIQEILREGE